MSADDFMEATLDVWKINPESARRVQHPAPFPVELPRRLIDLYTYEGDVVLDPFLGSGSTSSQRSAPVGADSVSISIRSTARSRRLGSTPSASDQAPCGRGPWRGATLRDPDDDDDRLEFFQARATSEGKKAADIAERVLTDAGFTVVSDPSRSRRSACSSTSSPRTPRAAAGTSMSRERSRPCDPA